MAISKSPTLTTTEENQQEVQRLDTLPPMGDAEEIEMEDGSVEIVFEDELFNEDEEYPGEFYDNLVDYLDDDTLERISEDVIDSFSADLESAQEWFDTIDKGLDLLGLQPEELNEPFEGACSAHHPLIIESAVKFQSKASAELLPANGPVRTRIMGEITPEKEKVANRKKNFMNYQLTEQMTEYYPDTERMLFYLPIVGSSFKKTYPDFSVNRPCSEFVPVDQFIVPYSTIDLKRAPRYTHVIYKTKNDLRKLQVSGFYSDVELGDPSQPEISNLRSKTDEITGITMGKDFNDVYTILEQHCDLNLDGTPFEDPDGIDRPYIVSVDKESGKVLSIYRNWSEDDENKEKRVWFTHYTFVPGMGFYGLGFIHLLGNLEMTLTTIMRSLVDAGQFANLQAGFKKKNIRISGGNDPLGFGEWRDVEAPGDSLRDSLLPLPYKEPSNVLFNMLEFIEGRGQKFADSTEQVIADSTNYGPVGTTLALLEASTKFFSSIHKRLHFAQKEELQLIAKINGEVLPQEYPYDVEGESRTIFVTDFDKSVEILPVSDPNISSNAHRVTMAQTMFQMATQAPQHHNMREVLNRMYSAMGIDHLDKILPPEQKVEPSDPLSDILKVTTGQPIKAFPGQDHQAHIQAKSAWLEDPQNGKNPLMQPYIPQVMANIREHMVMQWQEQITGLVPSGVADNPQVAEKVVAEAAQKIAQANQVMAAEGDPTLQAEQALAKAELVKAETEAERLNFDKLKSAAENAIDEARLDLDWLKEKNRAIEAGQKLDADMTKADIKAGAGLVKEAVKNLSNHAASKQKAKEVPAKEPEFQKSDK
jgi:hypothetical protein